MATNINVLVVVDTEHVYQNPDDPSDNNLGQTVTLVDDNFDSDETPGDSTSFLIKTDVGDKVQYRIIAANTTTGVYFTGFAWENEAPVHCFDPMPDTDNDWEGTAANVGEEKYSISFKVTGKGSFTLDPQLKVQQGGG